MSTRQTRSHSGDANPVERRASQEPENGGNSDEAMAPPRKRRKAPEPTTQGPPSKIHHVLADVNDCTMLICRANHDRVDLRATKILEIHLDASKMDDFTKVNIRGTM